MDLSKSYASDGRMGVFPLSAVDEEKAWKLGDALDFIVEDLRVVRAVYLQTGTGGVNAGDVCTYVDGVARPASAVAYQGAAACVACADVPPGQFGWYAVSGTVPVLATASTTKEGGVYLADTAGQTTSAAVAGMQVLGAAYAEDKTIDALDAALVTLDHPHLQGQIT